MSFITQGKTNWKFLSIVVILTVIVGGGILAYQYLWLLKEEAKNSQKPVACIQEAKICPDGSTVSRTGPNCEFAACPTAKADETGTYEYSESAPPDEVWVYNLEVYKERDQLMAKLNIDGFQTLTRIQANVKESNGNLDIIFNSYGPENIGTPFQKGDLLFSLQKVSNGNYKIIWNKLNSNLLNPPNAEFKKIQDETVDWQTYEWIDITFKYPPTWTVEKIYYQTPVEQLQGKPPENIGVRLFPGDKLEGNDFITIGGHQVSCESSENHTKCQFISSISDFIYTDSNNPDILKVFDQIAPTKEVVVTTDKKEYKKGDIVEITIKNNLDQSIGYWDYIGQFIPAFDVQIFSNGKWENIEKKSTCACKTNCTPYTNGWVELKQKNEIINSWDTKDDCSGIIINPGQYRALFSYSLDLTGQGSLLNVYSNEFTIVDETANSKTYRNEKIESLKNSEYYIHIIDGVDKKIKLQDGKYVEKSNSEDINVEIVEDKIAFGNLRSNKSQYAVVILNVGQTVRYKEAEPEAVGDFFHSWQLIVLEDKNGYLSYVDNTIIGDKAKINSVSIESGKIVIDMLVLGLEDAMCCPSKNEKLQFLLSNNKLIEIDEIE